MPQQPHKPHQGGQQGQQAQGEQAPALPPEVESQIPQGQAALSRATGQSLSQMEPRRVIPHLVTLLAELAAGLQVLQKLLQNWQGPQQPPPAA